MTVLLKPGATVRLAVTGLGSGGEGVGRASGIPVFVPYAAPGDEVLARLTSVHRSYARAALVEVLSPSPDRTSPPCPVFYQCGGCQLQHIAYPAQLAHKRQRVIDTLGRIGGLGEVPVAATVAAPEAWGYRNKAQFPVAAAAGEDRAGVGGGRAPAGVTILTGHAGAASELVAGCYASGTHDVIPVNACPIQNPLNNRVIQAALAAASRHGVRAYDETTGCGVLRHVMTRVNSAADEALCVLVTSRPDLPAGPDLAADIRRRVPAVVGVCQNINLGRTNVVLGPTTKTLAGRPFIRDRLCGLKFHVSALSFFQVNPRQAEAVYETALGYAAPLAGAPALDVYAGAGALALLAAARGAGPVVGVEVVADAVRDARANARRNGLAGARFLLGEARDVLPALGRGGFRPAAVFLDPPRHGCEAGVVGAVAALAPPVVVYVSCNPATLARDLREFAQWGFAVAEVTPLDMFPQTAHVECVARLTARRAGGARPAVENCKVPSEGSDRA
jgi:23S rRNA (uracil1939-C5)-methyltransferase